MLNCLCGSDKSSVRDNFCYSVTSEGKTIKSKKKLKVYKCSECGLERQGELPFNSKQSMIDFYKSYPPTQTSYEVKDKKHDSKVAEKRLEQFNVEINKNEFVLDIGSGSGSFVNLLRQKNINCYGCEISEYASNADVDKYIYKKDFEEIYFPTDKFDKVFCFDVLEHVLDPISFLKEMHRVTKQEGYCVIEIPDFYCDEGKHHWKEVEHIWFFTSKYLESVFEDIGFIVEKINKPIEGKITFTLIKKKEKRIKILVPPGIGDAYWSITKIESFLKLNKIKMIPDIHVACNKVKEHDGHKRAFPFIEMFPFLHSSGEAIGDMSIPNQKQVWTEAYAERKRTIFRNVLGCDYFISYNGHLRFGEQMEDIDPNLKTDWFPKRFISLEEEQYKEEAIEKYGDYIVFYFVFQGTYKYWIDEFPIFDLIESIKNIVKNTKYTPVFVGAKWDSKEEFLGRLIKSIPGAINLTGKTSVGELFGLLRGSKLVVGYPSGLSILSAVLKVKTLIIWNGYYNKQFWWNACPPETREKNYFITGTKLLTKRKFVEKVLTLCGTKYTKEMLPKEEVIKKEEATIKMERLRKSIKVAVLLYSDSINKKGKISKSLGDIKHEFITIKESITDLFKENLFDKKYTHILFINSNVLILKDLDNLILSALQIDKKFIYLKPWMLKNVTKKILYDLLFWENGRYSSIHCNYIDSDICKYLFTELLFFKRESIAFQEISRGIYSFKRHCTSEYIPVDSKVICFHSETNVREIIKNHKELKEVVK